jgi:hypothetical protein
MMFLYNYRDKYINHRSEIFQVYQSRDALGLTRLKKSFDFSFVFKFVGTYKSAFFIYFSKQLNIYESNKKTIIMKKNNYHEKNLR